MRLHGTEAWRRRAKQQLREHPLCHYCLQQGRVVPAVCADHIEPHRGDVNKFVLGRLQSLCGHCHNSHKQSVEKLGYDRTIGIDGWPVDPLHPAYQPRAHRVRERPVAPFGRDRRP